MSLSHSPKIVTDGLVLCLDAANPRSYPKSGTTWSDLAGSNDGAMSAGFEFDSNNRGSLIFDRANDWVNLGTSPQDLVGQGSATTISAWFNSDNSNQTMIMGNGMYLRFYIEIFPRSGSLVAHWGFGGSQNSSTSQAFISTNAWYHYTATYDQSVAKGYLNGVNTDSDTIGSQTYGGALYVGSWGTNGFLWGGEIAMVSIYNRALTADEVRQNYNATKRRFK
jgi:hypothetical protein